MSQYGLVNDISYAGFLESLEKENSRRKEAVLRSIPVYGPIEFQAHVYYEYLLSERTARLKSLLSKTKFSVTEDELKSFFNSQRPTRYKEPSRIKIEKIIYPEGESYSEVREQVYRDFIDVKYEGMIGRLVDRAVIDVIEEIEI